MLILRLSISIFVAIECLNILTLYFNSDSKIGNGVGVFNALAKSKEDNVVFPLVKYLIDWVAGAKLIFIMIGIAVVIFGNEQTLLFTVIALIISILSFYWRLFPSIKELDLKGQITPKGYSKTLNIMIISFLAVFAIALLIYFL